MSSIRVAQESARGTVILLVSNVVSTGVLTASTVLVARLLGPSGYGLFTLAFVIPSALVLFVGFGVNIAVTRFVALHVSTGEVEAARSITRTASLVTVLFGAGFAVLNYATAPFIVPFVFHRPQLTSYDEVASLWVFGLALTQASSAAFIGWGSMATTGLFGVLLAFLRLCLPVGLILAGFGVLGGVLGNSVAYVVDGCAAALVLAFTSMKPFRIDLDKVEKDLRAMIAYGLAPFGANIALGLGGDLAAVVLAALVANSVVGYFQAAVNVLVAMTVFSTAIAATFLRSFATLDGIDADLPHAFSLAVKYSSYVLTPIAVFLIAAAVPLVDVFYGHTYHPSVALLELAAASQLPTAIGYQVLIPFFNGIGRGRFTLLVSTIFAVVYVMGSILFGKAFGLGADGVLLALVAANLASTLAGLAASKRYLNASLRWSPLAGLLAASLIGGVVVHFLPLSSLTTLEALIIDAVVYLLVYLTTAPLLAVDELDISRLRSAAESLGPLRGFLELILDYEFRLAALKRKPGPRPVPSG